MGKVADYIKTLPYINTEKPQTRTDRARQRGLAEELLEELIQEYKARHIKNKEESK